MKAHRYKRAGFALCLPVAILTGACSPYLICRDVSTPITGFPIPVYEEVISISSDSAIDAIRIPNSQLRCAIQENGRGSHEMGFRRKLDTSWPTILSEGIVVQEFSSGTFPAQSNCLKLSGSQVPPGLYRPSKGQICPILVDQRPGELGSQSPERTQINIQKVSKIDSNVLYSRLDRLIAACLDSSAETCPAPRANNYFYSASARQENASDEGNGDPSEVTVRLTPSTIKFDPPQLNLSVDGKTPATGVPAHPLPEGIAFDRIVAKLDYRKNEVCAKELEISFTGNPDRMPGVQVCRREPQEGETAPTAFLTVHEAAPSLCTKSNLIPPSTVGPRNLTVEAKNTHLLITIPQNNSILVRLKKICT